MVTSYKNRKELLKSVDLNSKNTSKRGNSKTIIRLSEYKSSNLNK